MTTDKTQLSKTLIKAAWMSVGLGLLMQLLLLAAAAFFKNIPTVQAIVADTVQKISWSTLVCSGVAVGLAAGKMRPHVMGIAGLIAAPVAFYVAKIAHKSVSQALSITGAAAIAAPDPFVLAGLKGVEYAVLGVSVGLLGRKTKVGLRGHIIAGIVIGVLFGGLIVALMMNAAAAANTPLGIGAIVTRCINEIIFPVGCALVLYAAQKVGEKQSDTDRADVETTDAVPSPKESEA